MIPSKTIKVLSIFNSQGILGDTKDIPRISICFMNPCLL